MSADPKPEAVERAQRSLAKTKPDDKARDYEYEKLSAAYDGFLFDLDQGSMKDRDSIISRTLKDDTGREHAPMFHEIPANLIRPLTEDWKSVIGVQPSVYCPPTRPGDQEANMRANKREKIIEAIDSESAMDIHFLEGAHYQTLYGCQIHQCIPDPDKKSIIKRVSSPYHAHARLSLDGINLHYLAFDYEEDTDLLVEEFPGLSRHVKKEDGRFPDTMTVTEWNDRNYRMFLVNGEYVDDLPLVHHGWGFVPAVIIPNIVGTGSIWSRSDAQQAIYLAQVISEEISMAHDALFQHVHDQVIIKADKPVNQFSSGPYEYLQIEKEADFKLLHAGLQLPDISASLSTLERILRLQGGWPEVMSSELDSSVISGKAFTAAQGPVAARAAIKHIVMAAYMQRINSFALQLYDMLFPYEEIEILRVTGGVATSVFPKAGRSGSEFISFIPSQDIAGRYENLLTFSPGGTDRYRQAIEWLQYAEAGVISINFIRENTQGIDPQAMEAEVAREFMEKAERQVRAQQMAMGAQMQAQMQMASAQAPAQQGAAPEGQPTAPEMNVGPMSPQVEPNQPAPAVPGARPGRVTLREATQIFKAVRNVRGQVVLAGAIVSTGWTDGPIEVYVEDPQDKGTLIRGTPYGKTGKLLFHNFPVPQDENVVDVTPLDARARREEEAVTVG
jgi:hypothetical protein